jgi:hypothetical protein
MALASAGFSSDQADATLDLGGIFGIDKWTYPNGRRGCTESTGA